VDFIRYAEGSAELLNADLSDVHGLVAHLTARPHLQERATDRDCMLLRKLQRELRPVFQAGTDEDDAAVVRLLNELMSRHPITPRISDHDADLHLHVASGTDSVAELLVAESLLGLAAVVCDLGPRRLGICESSTCDHAFVDVSPNQSRRYCSERCSSRANVAAYRARRRAVAGA
jgi:predicted RNA-binding Zn ribbon-like protein